MKKLLICAALFCAPLTACQWTNIWDEVLNYEERCLFYDAWNDAVVYGVPDDYMYDMFKSGASVVITHFVRIGKPDNIFGNLKYGDSVKVDLDEALE